MRSISPAFADRRSGARKPVANRSEWGDLLLEDLLGEETIMADLFDLEQTAVGLKANLPQSRQVAQMLADIRVACVVDGGFSPQSRPSLWYCLMRVPL